MPKFSVIVPAHNSADFIRIGLESIVEQKNKDYELIVVCDNCTDQTPQIAYKYADIMRVVNLGNDGLARNVGLEEASGEYVLFLDDDDWFMHEYAFDVIHENLNRWKWRMDLTVDILQFGFIFKGVGYAKARKANGSIWPNVWSKAWRREFIGDTRFQNIKMESDLDFTRRMLEKAPKLICLEQPLIYYNYMRKGSQTWNKANNIE